MTKERELLARAGLIIAQYRWSDPEDKGLQKLSQQINEYFEESAQDENPVAFIPTQRPFVGLSIDEILKLINGQLSPDWNDEFELYYFARDIEDALVEKNK